MKLRSRLSVLLQAGALALAGSALAGGSVAQAANFGVTIASRASGKCLTVPDASRVPGVVVVQRICDTSSIRGQHWIFQGPVGTGSRQVRSLDTGLCLDATGFNNGDQVVQEDCGIGAAGSFFFLIDLLPPSPQRRQLRFQSSVNTSVCLDLENGDIHDGVPLQVWQCNPNTDNQKWNIFSPTS